MPETTSAGGSLTAEQVQQYRDQGYLVLDTLLNAEDMAPARGALQDKVEIMAQELVASGLVTNTYPELPLETRLARLFEHLSPRDFLSFGRGWRDRLPGYFQLMNNRKVIDVAESLIGGEIFANPVYNIRPKVPRVAAGDVPWHQDKSYWPDANANPVITIWVALVDATPENGCLHILPGTHTTQLFTYHAEEYSGTGFLELDEQYVDARNSLALPLPAGGAIAFNDRLIHMSTPNTSDRCRWSVDLRYQPTDQDPMPQHGAGFLARSYQHPERVADLDDWLAGHTEHSS